MKDIEAIYEKWQSLLPLCDKKQAQLTRKFTVEYNYNSNHIEGNALTYGQTELLLLFGKVSGEAEMKDFEEMKASNVGLKMMTEEAKEKQPLTETFIRQLHHTLLREDYTVYTTLPGGLQSSYVVHAGSYKTRPNSVITRYGDRFEYASPEETPALMNDLVVGPTPSDGAHASLRNIRDFLTYFKNLVKTEIQTDIDFVTKSGENIWWYDGQIVTFRSDNTTKILLALQENPAITYYELTKLIGINTSAIQKQINNLIKKGYIQRRDSDKKWHVLITSTI